MTWFRINVDVGCSGLTVYTQAVDLDEDGHLWFVDEEGRKRTYSRAHKWSIVEVPTERIEQSAYLRDKLGIANPEDEGVEFVSPEGSP